MNDVKRYRFKGAAGEYVYATDYDKLMALKESLFEAITHGDHDHRTWLKAAIEAHFMEAAPPIYVASEPPK